MTADPEWGGQGLPAGFALAFRDAVFREHGMENVFGPYRKRRADTGSPRERRVEAALPAQDGVRRVDRHDVPDRGRNAGTDLGLLRTRRDPAGDGPTGSAAPRSSSPPASTTSPSNIVHLVLRAAAGRARRAPRASACSWSPSSCSDADGNAGRRATASAAAHRGEDGHPRLAHLRHALRRRGRLAGRRGERGPGVHVHDDEPRAAGRRPAGAGARGARMAGRRWPMPAIDCRAARLPARSSRTSPPIRSSSTRTCGGCC